MNQIHGNPSSLKFWLQLNSWNRKTIPANPQSNQTNIHQIHIFQYSTKFNTYFIWKMILYLKVFIWKDKAFPEYYVET